MKMVTKSKNSKKVKNIVSLIILLGAFFAFVIIFFNNPNRIVKKGVLNTLKDYVDGDNKLLARLDISNVVDSGKYTISCQLDTNIPGIGDTAINSDFMVDGKTVELSGDFDISYAPTVNYCIQLNDSEFKMHTPVIPEYLFVYEYDKDNSGYINEIANTKVINTFLDKNYSILTDNQRRNKAKKAFEKVFDDVYGKLKFSKGSTEKFSIGEKDVSATCYETTINSTLIKYWASNITQWSDDYYGNAFNTLGISKSDFLTFIDEFTKNHGDIKAQIYIYRGKLASIILTSKKGISEINFQGGDYQAQNVSLRLYDGNVISLNGKIEDNVEELSLEKNNQNILSYTFNIEDGRLKLKLFDNKEIGIDIINSENEISISMEYFNLGDSHIGGLVSIKKGSSINELNGTIFDLGMAGKDEYSDLINNSYSVIAEILGW